MDELDPAERERLRRRDRKRVTEMVVDGGNLRRQVQALRDRAIRRRDQAKAEKTGDAPGGR